METPEERMPGGRWPPVPGTNFESAAYALAVGMTTLTSVKRSLNWSGLTTERQMYDAVKPLCNTQILAWLRKEGAKFDSERPMHLTSISVVVESWNARMMSQIKVHISGDGQNIVVPSSGHDGCKSVYIRCTSSRWEAYAYFQNTATTTSPVQAANTFFTITQIDIKPTVDTDKPIDAPATTRRLGQKPWETESIKSMVDFLRGIPKGLSRTIEAICLYAEVLDVSHNDAIRPNVDRLCSDINQAGFTAVVLEDMFDRLSTNQEKESVWTSLNGFVIHEKEQQVMQRKEENAEQKGGEDVEQRKREEADAAAAVYAAQDRDDSCSDSD